MAPPVAVHTVTAGTTVPVAAKTYTLGKGAGTAKETTQTQPEASGGVKTPCGPGLFAVVVNPR